MANWQDQNFKKTSAATGPSSTNSKIAAPSFGTMHSKIARPTDARQIVARKVPKFADGTPGGFQDDATGVDAAVARNAADDAARLSETAQGDSNDGMAEAYNNRESTPSASNEEVRAAADTGAAKEEAPAKKQTFGEAFAANRKAGNATFEHNGKQFTTELKKQTTGEAVVSSVAKGMASRPTKAAEPEESLSQSLGRKFASLDQAANNAEKMPDASAQSKAMVRKLADDARTAYDDAAYAEKNRTSVVVKRR